MANLEIPQPVTQQWSREAAFSKIFAWSLAPREDDEKLRAFSPARQRSYTHDKSNEQPFFTVNFDVIPHFPYSLDITSNG